MTTDTQANTSWWGSFNFENGQSKEWNIGPLKFIVQRLKNEWQISYERTNETDNNNLAWTIADTNLSSSSLDDNSRYVFQNTDGQLSVSPKLADRPIISRPLTPFNLTAGEEITLYVSSTLWLELTTGSAPRKVLRELAIQRLSDTWFGPSTLEGELCYAASTHCRLNLDELPHRPHRAITPVLIRNRADTTLSVERLNLPAPLLTLYSTTDAQLWTPQITLTREKDGDMAELKIDTHPPEDVPATEQLCKPRLSNDSNALYRAFNTVFS